MAIPAYSLYAAYPACSLWLLHAYSLMRLILPAHYGYSMLMASPEGAMPPSSMTPAHYIMASLKGAMPLIIKFPCQASI
jgi:hypothetical protein